MLFVVRHGQTEWNLEERYQGQQDSPLTLLGRRQAQAVARRLADVPFDKIYASPLGRAWTTAGFLAEETGLTPVPDQRLMECSYGECEGLTVDDIDAKFPGKFAWRSEDKWHRRLPGAECHADLRARAQSFADENLDGALTNGGPTIGIVGHRGINCSLVGFLLGWNRDEIMMSYQANNVVFVLDGSSFQRLDVDVD